MDIYLAEVTLEDLLPKRGESVYSSGLREKDMGFVKFGPESIRNPILSIVNPIFDEDRNVIYPGFYELQLSDDRAFLTLVQSRKEIAKIPVFKVEEDKSEVEPIPMDNKSQKKYDKEQKKQAKKNKKLIKEGKIPPEPIIYSNATIEYDVKGDYYLIKYERERIRAWGALKI